MTPPASKPAAATLRREPTQQRSRERVERILDAADHLLATTGELGTKQVAAAANISIGSLYFWFPDKESIAQALADRYWGELADLVAAVQSSRPDDAVGETLRTMAAGFRARPGFLALWFGGLRTEAIRDATRPYRVQVSQTVERMLPPAADRATVARMVVLLGDGILREAFRIDRSGDATVLREGETALRAYIDQRLKG